MNYNEACNILNVAEGSSEEDIKKQFRKMAAKYHPDVNKTPEATEKSKQISEAYQFLKDYKPNSNINIGQHESNPFNFVNDILRNFGVNQNNGNRIHVQQTFKRSPPIQLSTTITFIESVLGTISKVTLNRLIRCEPCVGEGKIFKENCKNCSGTGIHSTKQSNMNVNITCWQCNGSGKIGVQCIVCKGECGVQNTAIHDVRIPAGVQNGQMLKLSGGGNFIPGFKAFEDAFLRINVTPDPIMILDGLNIISTIDISLLEAIEGKTTQTMTILGNKDIVIKPLSRHKDEIKIPDHGVNKENYHIVKLNVIYPDNINNLITQLKQDDIDKIKE